MLFIKLAGDQPDLGLEEVLSIHKALDLEAELVERDGRYCVINSRMDPTKLMERAAYVKEAGYFLVKFGKLEDIVEAFKQLRLQGTFKVDSINFAEEKIAIDRALGASIAKLGYKVDVGRPNWIIRVDKIGWAWVVPNYKGRRWLDRFPRRRPFFHPSALNPRVARALVNLATPRGILIDPFVGTGSILIEAGVLGIYGIGCDIDRRMVEGCMRNLKHYNILADVVQADARMLPFRALQSVATDLPYGRTSSTHGSKFEVLLTEFLDELKELLKGRAAIMYPSEYRGIVPEGKGFNLYVHKSLMRRISVLEF